MRNIPLLIALPATMVYTLAYAADYLSVTQAQQRLFPNSQAMAANVQLSEKQKAKIEDIAGVRQRFDEQQVWHMSKDDNHTGWVIVDNVIGKHEFITYATGIDLQGQVIGIEILSYRETHGSQVRKDQWRDSFKGKTLADKFKLNQDIPNISGATLSCRNLTDGVKRLLAVHQVALQN